MRGSEAGPVEQPGGPAGAPLREAEVEHVEGQGPGAEVVPGKVPELQEEAGEKVGTEDPDKNDGDLYSYWCDC